MEYIFERTLRLLGTEAMEKLKKANVAVFGLGGVGSFAAEALCRGGIYNFTLFDKDIVSPSNINRQLIALHSTIGRLKTEVMKERMLDINPDAQIITESVFYTPANATDFPLDKYNYIIDAIDTVTSKICLIKKAFDTGVPIISAMGTGNKLQPCLIKVADLYQTSVCPLAKVMRKELKALGINKLKVVYSDEQPMQIITEKNTRKQTPGSVSFVPSAAGLIMASEVIKDLIK
jgi:tRNA A37 threonylcarbamoyladenosine dehydratase